MAIYGDKTTIISMLPSFRNIIGPQILASLVRDQYGILLSWGMYGWLENDKGLDGAFLISPSSNSTLGHENISSSWKANQKFYIIHM